MCSHRIFLQDVFHLQLAEPKDTEAGCTSTNCGCTLFFLPSAAAFLFPEGPCPLVEELTRGGRCGLSVALPSQQPTLRTTLVGLCKAGLLLTSISQPGSPRAPNSRTPSHARDGSAPSQA